MNIRDSLASRFVVREIKPPKIIIGMMSMGVAVKEDRLTCMAQEAMGFVNNLMETHQTKCLIVATMYEEHGPLEGKLLKTIAAKYGVNSRSCHVIGPFDKREDQLHGFLRRARELKATTLFIVVNQEMVKRFRRQFRKMKSVFPLDFICINLTSYESMRKPSIKARLQPLRSKMIDFWFDSRNFYRRKLFRLRKYFKKKSNIPSNKG